jgi:hypothetical protein
MNQQIQELQNLINQSSIPVLVFVKKSKCNEMSTHENELMNNLKGFNKDVTVYVICYDANDVPFPEPAWNRVYFFAPKNERWIGSWDVVHLLKNFKDIYTNFEALMLGIPMDTYRLQLQSPKEVEKVRKMIETEDITKYPTAFQMSRNLFKEAWKSAKGVINTGQLLTSAENASERLSICDTCEFFNKKDIRCTQCGCFMEQKVHLKTASCPVKKW